MAAIAMLLLLLMAVTTGVVTDPIVTAMLLLLLECNRCYDYCYAALTGDAVAAIGAFTVVIVTALLL